MSRFGKIGILLFRDNKKGGWLDHLVIIVVFHGEVKTYIFVELLLSIILKIGRLIEFKKGQIKLNKMNRPDLNEQVPLFNFAFQE